VGQFSFECGGGQPDAEAAEVTQKPQKIQQRRIEGLKDRLHFLVFSAASA